MSFLQFVQLCESLGSINGDITKQSLIRQFIKNTAQTQTNIIIPVIKLLLINEQPQQYHMKGAKLTKLICKLTGIDPQLFNNAIQQHGHPSAALHTVHLCCS